MKPYLPYTDDVEQLQQNEAETIEAIVASMARGNAMVYDKHRHGLRDAHAKSHGILKGELRVHGDLPDHLRQGLFAEPRTYPIVVRYSTAPGDLRSDEIPTPRGMAIKVLNVDGPRARDDDDARSQDFLLVNAPFIPFGDVHSYLKVQTHVEKGSDRSDTALTAFTIGVRALSRVLSHADAELPPKIEAVRDLHTHILGETFHSMAALRFGNYIAKISAAPMSESLKALAHQTVPSDGGPSVLRDLVVEYFAKQSATYELRAQLCTDLTTMPIEDASVVWPDNESPHQPIATITLPQQNAYSNARRIYGDDVLSFTPWRSLAAHRPLGSIMRVRRKAYESSSEFRHRVNAIERVEPKTLDEIPD